VIHLDTARNSLIVGPAAQLGRQQLIVTDVNFVSGAPPAYPAQVTTKIRYTGSEVPATLHPAPENQIAVHLGVPLRDVTPGQAAVFYAGEVLLGGGTIVDSGPPAAGQDPV
jgi:tRNA-specific 2-thiouridylase